MKKIAKLNFLTGKKTYIVGGLMVVHGLSQIITELINGEMPDQFSVMEVMNGFIAIFLRKAV